MKNTLSQYSYINSVLADSSGAPGTTGADGVPIDVSGCDGVLFIARLDTIAAGCTGGYARLYPMVGDSSGTVVSCTGTSEYAYTTDLTTAHDNMSLVLDVRKPNHRWVGAHLYKDTTNAYRADILGIAYNAQYQPTTQLAAQVIHTQVSFSPTT